MRRTYFITTSLLLTIISVGGQSAVAQTSAHGSSENPYVHTYGATQGSYHSYQRSAAVQTRQVQGQAPAAATPTKRPHAYNLTDTIESGGLKRTYSLHVPASYTSTKSMPVVLVFHGLGMDGNMMIWLTNFNTYADSQGFIVAYPDGYGHRWEDGRSSQGVDDVQFVHDIIKKLRSKLNIDTRKIYACGISNGGHFVQYLALQSDDIAAIGVVSASIMANAANAASARRIPTVLFLGTDDPLVPSSDPEHNATLGKLGDAVGLGGLGSLSAPLAKIGGLTTAEETVNFWCSHNACPSSPYTVQMPKIDPRDGTRVTRSTYGGYGNEVVYYSIQGGGHTWPGAIFSGPKDLVGRSTRDINATALIAEFFARH